VSLVRRRASRARRQRAVTPPARCRNQAFRHSLLVAIAFVLVSLVVAVVDVVTARRAGLR
ncbi:hypothetical protein ACWCSH_39975, partial [Streptosporangium sp. NPDC001682]